MDRPLKNFFGGILLLCMGFGLQGQTGSPAEEFRGVWIATVNNIDYPKTPTPNSIAHEEQFKNLLHKFKSYGFNAAIVQVRPVADAFYPSEMAPWSAYLTGSQGLPPLPESDLLAFMIRQAHQNSMEFHAWINPFRAAMSTNTDRLVEGHVLKKHPSWGLTYGDKLYLNPGIPEVRQHIVQVVEELLVKYDLDAIHVDDYFYPYPIAGVPFPDSATFLQYGGGYTRIEDWRRANVDALIQLLSEKIREKKAHVKFGISPFGVWRNQERDPLGSPTRAGATSYDDLYADVVKWARMGWIDYLLPQLYWNIGYEPADYAQLLAWWARTVPDVQLLIGQAAYKVGNNPVSTWQDPAEIGRQIQLNRSNPVVRGSAFFSANSILRNSLGLKDSLQVYFRYPALIPAGEQSGSPVLPKAPNIKKIRNKAGNPLLVWKTDKQSPHFYYVLYRFEEKQTDNFEDGRFIQYISPFQPSGRRMTFQDSGLARDRIYRYVLVGADRRHQKRSSEGVQIWTDDKGFQRVKWPGSTGKISLRK
ncbi:MAG: family 10 glycosylhydrolase [Saprospiraceae bacterium]|nr:family 10 glycosylhydrolase [Saprospiraceae bacterium]